MIFSIIFEFLIGGFVDLNQSEVFVSCDGEADSANAGVEVEDFFGFDILFNFRECQFVNREVNLEEAVWAVGILLAEDLIL